MNDMREYMVVGVYDDPEHTRFAESVAASSPEEAERLILEEHGEGAYEIIVAGVLTVVAGAIEVVA